MKSFKKIIAVAGSVALMASTTIPAIAAEPESTAATANVLAYSLESVVVPTALKVALNPQGLEVTTKTDVTSTEQIVSLNYGMANLSTADKDVTVSFKVTGTADAEKTPITFVDSAEKATFGTGDDNAKLGQLKMYLAVVAADGDPTIADESSTAFAVADKTGANEHNATKENLADVAMTKASDGKVTFAKGDDYANAEIAFKLNKSVYAVQDGKTIDWDTTQETLKDNMEITTLGGVTGFTFIGAMNTGADWTKADVSALTITPIYGVADITGTEVAVTDGGDKQIETTPAEAAPSIAVKTYTFSQDNDVEISVNLGAGDLAATGITSITYNNGGSTLPTAKYSFANGVITISASYINDLITYNVTTRDYTITFDDEAGTTETVTLSAE